MNAARTGPMPRRALLRSRLYRVLAAFACTLVIDAALAGEAPAASGAAPDPAALLAKAKEATGGAAWDALRTQHSKVRVINGPDQGDAERWASLTTGRSRMRMRLAKDDVVLGYDGLNAWLADASGHVVVQRDPTVLELIVNAAYRDRLAFWFPERHGAKIEYARRDSAGGASFDVLRIAPDGGKPYEIWINTATSQIERLREQEKGELRLEVYSNFRSVQGGVKIPFTVTVTHGDQTGVERYIVESLEYNVSLDKIDFSAPTSTPLR